MLYIGLMTGTSMDGIDAGLIETDGLFNIKEHGGTSISYNPDFKNLLKSAELAVKKYSGDLDLATQNFQSCIADYLKYQHITINNSNFKNFSFDQVIEQSTKLHKLIIEKLLKKFSLLVQDITAIGYHGQTLLHLPKKQLTIQAGDGQLLSNLTTTQVINNFRSLDVQLGGQGAPLAPIYHQALVVRDQLHQQNFNNIAVVNCGGIANITFINGKTELDLLGFDTGPGNNLLDQLVTKKTNGKQYMDTNGNYGMQGKVNQLVLEQLFNQAIPLIQQKNYFKLSPPKSLDAHDIYLLNEVEELSLTDGCATLAAFTAQVIVNSLDYFPQGKTIPTTWVLAGGGWSNQKILLELQTRLTDKLNTIDPILAKQLQIINANDFGWDQQYMEAYVVGYLAARRLHNYPTSFPSVTGVRHPISAGDVYMPNHLDH